MRHECLEGIEELEEVCDQHIEFNHWWNEINCEPVSQWLQAVEGDSVVSAELIRVASSRLEASVAMFRALHNFTDTLERVRNENSLLNDLIFCGLNNWQSGYKWIAPSRDWPHQWSQSAIFAFDRLVGVPFRAEREENLAAFRVIEECGATMSSIEAVKRMRQFAREWMFDFGLQNPVYFEDTIGGRIGAEISQLRAMVSGVSCRLPVPPRDWLTPKEISETAKLVFLKSMQALYSNVTRKPHSAPDELVGKDQQGIRQLRTLQALGLYKGYVKRPTEHISKEVNEIINRFNLTRKDVTG